MRIIQLTDLHIGREGQPAGNVDVRKNFTFLLSEVVNQQPDMLVLTGDLCLSTGDPDVYTWIRHQLENLPFPWYAIPGNHDESVLLAKGLGCADLLVDQDLFYKLEVPTHLLLFMDSSRGMVSPNQLTWLKETLRSSKKPVLLFIHHPVVPVHMPFMEQRYYLKNRDQVEHILIGYPFPVHLFCGHYHILRHSQKLNIHQYLTSSTYFQLDSFAPVFKIAHYRIGLRIIDFSADHLETQVLEYEGNKVPL